MACQNGFYWIWSVYHDIMRTCPVEMPRKCQEHPLPLTFCWEEVILVCGVFWWPGQSKHLAAGTSLFRPKIRHESMWVSQRYCMFLFSTEPTRITPQSLFSDPPYQSTWMFTKSLIQEWSGKVFWCAAWRHYAITLLSALTCTIVSCKIITRFARADKRSVCIRTVSVYIAVVYSC